MCIRRTQCRNKYRNIGNLWKRIYNTVEIALLLHCNAFKTLPLIKISGWFYLAPLFSIFISCIPQNLDFLGQINCWSFIAHQVDHILIIKMKSSCCVVLVSSGVMLRYPGHWRCSSPLHLPWAWGQGLWRWVPTTGGRWRCSLGLCKLSTRCVVTSSCCFSLSLRFKYDISVQGCSQYEKLSNICECLSVNITAFYGIGKSYPKYSLLFNLVML